MLDINWGDKTDAKLLLSAFSITTKLQITSSHVFKLLTSSNCFILSNTYKSVQNFILVARF